MTTATAPAPRDLVGEVADRINITGELLAALAWWWIRYGAARLGIALLDLLRAIPHALAGVAVWAWRLPRENQAVLAVTLAATGIGVHVAFRIAADPRTMIEVFGPPLWMLGIVAALFVAKGVQRPIVALVPFGAALWWISPQAAVMLVTLSVIVATWKTTRRTHTGSIVTHTTLTGARIATSHFVPSPDANWREFAAWHEGGHGAAAVAAGGRVVEARLYASGGGHCKTKLPCRKSLFQAVVDDVAVSAGGECATHSTRGCEFDHADITRTLKQLPSHQRAMARTAGYAQARRGVLSHAHVKRAIASALLRTGRYH